MSNRQTVLPDKQVAKLGINVPIEFEKKSFQNGKGVTVNYSQLFDLGKYNQIELPDVFFELDGNKFPVVIKKLKLDILVPKVAKQNADTPQAIAYIG